MLRAMACWVQVQCSTDHLGRTERQRPHCHPCCSLQLSFLGPELVCQWGISSTAEGFLTTAVFIGMML